MPLSGGAGFAGAAVCAAGPVRQDSAWWAHERPRLRCRCQAVPALLVPPSVPLARCARIQHGGRMSERLRRLKVLLGEIYDLERVGYLLAWDEETTMPPEGAASRAEQRATIGRAAHKRLVSPKLGRMLEEL